jgi:hypothetical protein
MHVLYLGMCPSYWSACDEYDHPTAKRSKLHKGPYTHNYEFVEGDFNDFG